MYISEIKIKNFRNFSDVNVLFRPDLNIIIGHNNSGKTNLIRALQLVLDRNLKEKPTIDDFCKTISDYFNPPFIEISLILKEYNDKPDDKNVVYDWLIKDSPNYEAQLTYVFKLPTKNHKEYQQQIEFCRNKKGKFIQEKCLKLINKKFLSKYVSRIYGGNPSKQEKADTENLERFDFQFLNAIRDAERHMFFGNNTLLRDVLNYFLDYDLTQGQGFENLSAKQKVKLQKREEEFISKSNTLLKSLIGRVDKDKILEYSKDTGAEKGGSPNFDADITEQELLFALRLIVKKTGFKLPIKFNGLGYNNLLFIALILAKMQMESSAFMGDNAKVFPILAIEEPEAHLHPSMQSKFLKFLKDTLKTNNQARQIFITSHSTHITCAVELDSIICIYQDLNSKIRIGYPSRVFSESQADKNSKIYIQRFLDATKSNMLFADKVIFVEGLAEQLLIPCFAEYLNLENKLIADHIAIVSVDSRTFKHFLKIFAFKKEELNEYAIDKKVVCITDADPCIKVDNKWISAFPFMLDDSENSKALSNHIEELTADFTNKFDNIFIYHPEPGKGKTLEYEIAYANPKSELLITDSFPKQNSAHTIENYKGIISEHGNSLEQVVAKYKSALKTTNENENDILKAIKKCNWKQDSEKSTALIAAIYYTIVNKIKGEHSFYLEKKLRDNFQKKPEEKLDFKIPEYIKNALTEIVD